MLKSGLHHIRARVRDDHTGGSHTVSIPPRSTLERCCCCCCCVLLLLLPCVAPFAVSSFPLSVLLLFVFVSMVVLVVLVVLVALSSSPPRVRLLLVPQVAHSGPACACAGEQGSELVVCGAGRRHDSGLPQTLALLGTLGTQAPALGFLEAPRRSSGPWRTPPSAHSPSATDTDAAIRSEFQYTSLEIIRVWQQLDLQGCHSVACVSFQKNQLELLGLNVGGGSGTNERESHERREWRLKSSAFRSRSGSPLTVSPQGLRLRLRLRLRLGGSSSPSDVYFFSWHPKEGPGGTAVIRITKLD
eukprot:2064684-Rhodomonas_salina.1